jgi:hypothetical protein
MTAKDWLEKNGIAPESVSDTLLGLLDACDDPKVADMLRIGLFLTEPTDDAH